MFNIFKGREFERIEKEREKGRDIVCEWCVLKNSKKDSVK